MLIIECQACAQELGQAEQNFDGRAVHVTILSNGVARVVRILVHFGAGGGT